MIVDCHTHITSPSGGADSADHLDATKNVDACIVLANHDSSNDDANKAVSEYVSRHQGQMVGFATLDPVNDKIGSKHIAFLKEELQLKGLVLYCARDGFHPTHTRAMQLYETAAQMNMPVFFHNASPLRPNDVLDYSQPWLLDEIARTLPDLKIIIGGMGLPFLQQTLCMLNKYENVYADLRISPNRVWQVYNMVLAAHEADVMDKLLFGSGFPHGQAGACIEVLLGLNRLFADTNLPTVPRGQIRNVIERDSLSLLGIES